MTLVIKGIRYMKSTFITPTPKISPTFPHHIYPGHSVIAWRPVNFSHPSPVQHEMLLWPLELPRGHVLRGQRHSWQRVGGGHGNRLLSRFLWFKCLQAGGFNPVEKYWSNWESSPSRCENEKYLKPPPSLSHVLECLWMCVILEFSWNVEKLKNKRCKWVSCFIFLATLEFLGIGTNRACKVRW